MAHNDTIDRIIAFEEGLLSEDESIALFQHLHASGLIAGLQGRYGRHCAKLIEAGLIS